MTESEVKQGVIQINVTSNSFEDVVFKIKKSTRFEKLFKTYQQKYNLTEAKNIRFVFEGETIQGDQTPENLGLKDQDTIECVVE